MTSAGAVVSVQAGEAAVGVSSVSSSCVMDASALGPLTAAAWHGSPLVSLLWGASKDRNRLVCGF